MWCSAASIEQPSKISTMETQSFKVCFSLFIVLSLFANYSVSSDSSEQHAPTASESGNKSASSESYVSVPPTANIPDAAESNGTLPQEIASSPSVSADHTNGTKSDKNFTTSPSPSPSVVDSRDTDSLSRENTSVPLSEAAPPAAETKEAGNNVPKENTLVPTSPRLSPAYIDAPAFRTSDDGSLTQENQSPPPSENPENVPQLNDYSSLPSAAVPAPSEALSYPELDPTIESAPSNDDSTYDSAPTSNQHTILPFNYRAEDEPVEPYEEEEEDSWSRGNGAVAGALVCACVIGMGGFVYQKRKKDNVRAQYQYQGLAKKEGV